MKLRIEADMAAVRSKSAEISDAARRILTEQALHDIYPLVPYQTHTLANSALQASDPVQGLLIWDTPYARIRYTSGRPRHPETVTHWVEKAADAHMQNWAHIAEAALGMRN